MAYPFQLIAVSFVTVTTSLASMDDFAHLQEGTPGFDR